MSSKINYDIQDNSNYSSNNLNNYVFDRCAKIFMFIDSKKFKEDIRSIWKDCVDSTPKSYVNFIENRDIENEYFSKLEEMGYIRR